ncbi:hypothetical protein CDOMF_0388 [Campylobacter sp. RM16187]|nr:hypothetical protein CDOMF_0388 [Campylobacter sp. RM16187]
MKDCKFRWIKFFSLCYYSIFIALSIYISGGYALINLLKNFYIILEKSIKIDLNLIDIVLKL